ELQGKLDLSLRVARTVGDAEIGILDRGIQAAAQYRMVERVEELCPELQPSGLVDRKGEVPEDGHVPIRGTSQPEGVSPQSAKGVGRGDLERGCVEIIVPGPVRRKWRAHNVRAFVIASNIGNVSVYAYVERLTGPDRENAVDRPRPNYGVQGSVSACELSTLAERKVVSPVCREQMRDIEPRHASLGLEIVDLLHVAAFRAEVPVTTQVDDLRLGVGDDVRQASAGVPP